MSVLQSAKAAKEASIYLAAVSTSVKNNALQVIADEIKKNEKQFYRQMPMMYKEARKNTFRHRCSNA